MTGSPETLYLFMMSSAWRTDISGRDGDGIDDHSAFRALHAVDFFGLALDGHVAVNESDAALARDGDGQARVGDGVHRRGHDGDIQRDLAREARARVRLRRAAPRISRAAAARRQTSALRGQVRQSFSLLISLSNCEGWMDLLPENSKAQHRSLGSKKLLL